MRDGLTRAERLILVHLRNLQQELGRESVPTIMLYGRVSEHVDVPQDEFQSILRRLVGRG